MQAFAEANETIQSVQQAARKVTGVVSDSQGPLIGATVKEKGTANGTATDLNGNFVLNVKSGATLVVTYVGYVTKEVKVPANAGSKIFITLEEEQGRNLNEVVVIGYGTQRREAVTGSVANMQGDKLNQVAASNAAYALQGRVAGVLMTQTSSQPGAEMQIRIRGQRSLTASNDPLIVLDGIPFMGNLSDINPADIKSMDILKDASATAIYGSRGANGVIMITTTKGTQGTPAKVSYNAYVGVKKLFHRYPMMSGPQLAQLRKDAGLFTNSLEESDDTDTDWQDLFFRTGIQTSHDIGVSGGTQGGSYSFGAGYYHDEAVIPTQQFDRYSVRGNFDQKVGEYFRFGLTTNNGFRINKGNQIGVYNALSMSPLASPYDENGNLKRIVTMPNDQTFVMTKEVVESLEDTWLSESKTLSSYNTLFAEVQCPWVKGLSYRINIGLNYRHTKGGSFTGTGINNTDPNYINSASVDEQNTTNWAIENLITYDRIFNEKHHINVVGMYSAEQTTYEKTSVAAKGIPAEYFHYYNLGTASSEITVNPDNWNYWQSGLMSWMGRVMYTYDNKYMLSATLRADASSRLAKGHQWHTYPAVSAGWNISRESFMEDLKWIDNLKLRVGYGETSNQSINPYSTLGRLSQRRYNFGTTFDTGYYVSALPNPELGWEYSRTWNFGVDFSLFGGRLSGSMEYYVQNTRDLLLDVSMPSTSGVGSYTANVGKTQNKGFEMSLNGIILDNKNGWNWEAGLNFYFNRNKLVELASGAERDEANRWFVGHPIDVIYDYNKVGLWQEGDPYLDILEPGGNVGMIKVEYTGDYNADGTPTRQIGPDDRQIQSMEPDLMGGFNTTVGYKGFDLTVIGSFQIGGTLISTLHSSYGYLNMLTGRRGNIDVDYWTPENTDAKYPKPGGVMSSDNPKYGSTLGYFDAGYLKIRTITLGYNFDRIKAVRDFGISKLRAYVSVQNPFVLFSPFNNECGLDPETNTYSNNGGTMAVTMDGYNGKHVLPVVGYNTPSTRNFLFGINVTF
ncbi:MAG: TonB-dependent receptor [Prevotella sp.]|nr:TonB-dependent receptor [Prevotella sp. P2-180]MCI7089036.1 TonB-dependent receptor [Prevotella sp.]MCI7255868.1 TonB-dependent receptor [Prevotella sp.]MDD5784211.1 TonB-dependent receptor [Prevotella sp.]MDD7226747.1 TonB-dependent receptor [Prevotella sp.]MDY4498318.1 TonB-dependent receptor [Prevotella sp.]